MDELIKNNMTKKYLKLDKTSDTNYKVYFEPNNIYIGDFSMDVDGYFYLWLEPDSSNGCWSDYILIELGETLKELNKVYNDSVTEYFNNQK